MLFVLAAAVLAATLFAYRRAFYSPDKVQNDVYNIPCTEQYEPYRGKMVALIDALCALPYEEVSVRSHDGLLLRGKYYHFRDGASLAIGVHGYRGTAERDMCLGTQIAREAGQNVLLIDQRAHGASEGHCISFGILERRDVCTWTAWARERFGAETKILLYGVSMGAASVLMASPMLRGEICGIVADSPYSSPADIIRKVSRDEGLPVPLIYPFVVLSARLLGGFNLTETTAADAVKDCAVPVLVIHGEEDRYVPKEMSALLSAPQLRRETFPDAGHGISAMVHTERYCETVGEFIKNCIRE